MIAVYPCMRACPPAPSYPTVLVLGLQLCHGIERAHGEEVPQEDVELSAAHTKFTHAPSPLHDESQLLADACRAQHIIEHTSTARAV